MVALFAFAAVAASVTEGDIRSADRVVLGSSPYIRIQAPASGIGVRDATEASLASQPNGGFMVAWQSVRAGEALSGISVRRFDRLGLPLAAEVRLSQTAESSETRPAVVLSARGRALVLRESLFADGSGLAVVAGSRVGNETTRGDQGQVSSARIGPNRNLAVWSGQTARDRSRIFGRPFDDSGKPLGAEIAISKPIDGLDVLPTIAPSSAGASIAWQRIGRGRTDGIRVVFVDSNGRVASSEQAVTDRLGLEPSLAAAGTGFVLGWIEPTRDGGHRAHARRLDSWLRPAGSEVELPRQPGYQNGIAVAGRADGSFAVAWNQELDHRRAVYAQLFCADGTCRGAALKIAGQDGPRSTFEQESPDGLAQATGRTRLAYLEDGSLTVVWKGEGIPHREGVYFTRLIPAGLVARVALPSGAPSTDGRLSAVATLVPSRPVVQVRRELSETHRPPTFDPKLREDPWGSVGSPDDIGFNAIVNTGWTPPDPHMAVGPSHVVVVTNGAIATFTKTGTRLWQTPIEGASGFWGSLGATGFVFDPEAFYDRISGRYWAMAAEGYEPNSKSHVLIAVSATADPTSAWYKYRIETTGYAGNLFDSPNLGVDANVVYVTGDGFGITPNYPVYTFDKASMLNGLPPAVMRSTTLATTTQSAGIAHVQDGDSQAYYMLEHREGSSQTGLRLIALTDPLGTPTFTTTNIAVPAYSAPEDPPQLGTTTRPDTFDARFWSVAYRNGDLWACHHVSVPVRSRWYQIRLNGWPFSGQQPSLIQSGEVVPGTDIRTMFCSIDADSDGSAVMGMARSSPSEYLSMFVAARKITDPLGTMPQTQLIKASTAPYSTARWGDYSGTMADPAVPGTFWSHHEWNDAGAWRTWVAPVPIQFTVDERAVDGIYPVLAGTILGGLPELSAADGAYLTIAPAPIVFTASLSSVVDYTATSATPLISAMDVRVVAKTGTGTGQIRLSMLNRQTGKYDPMGAGDINNGGNTAVTFQAIPNSNSYLDPGTGQIRMRLSFYSLLQPSLARPTLLIDEIKVVTRY